MELCASQTDIHPVFMAYLLHPMGMWVPSCIEILILIYKFQELMTSPLLSDDLAHLLIFKYLHSGGWYPSPVFVAHLLHPRDMCAKLHQNLNIPSFWKALFHCSVIWFSIFMCVGGKVSTYHKSSHRIKIYVTMVTQLLPAYCQGPHVLP